MLRHLPLMSTSDLIRNSPFDIASQIESSSSSKTLSVHLFLLGGSSAILICSSTVALSSTASVGATLINLSILDTSLSDPINVSIHGSSKPQVSGSPSASNLASPNK